MNLYTARVTYGGDDAINITRGLAENHRRSGLPRPEGEFLAPSAALVFPTLERMKEANTARDRQWLWEEYAAAYREEMLASYRTRRDEWEALLRRERATLVCFCAPMNGVLRCHRVLAAGHLARLGATYLGEIGALNP